MTALIAAKLSKSARALILIVQGGFGGILSVFWGVLGDFSSYPRNLEMYRFKNGIKKALPSVTVRII